MTEQEWGSVLVQVEVRLVGPRDDMNESVELLRQGVARWARARQGVVGTPILRVTDQPYTLEQQSSDPDEIFGEEKSS